MPRDVGSPALDWATARSPTPPRSRTIRSPIVRYEPNASIMTAGTRRQEKTDGERNLRGGDRAGQDYRVSDAAKISKPRLVGR